MKNIVLIGMPGCGKSSIGRQLAKRLQRSFYDADEVLEAREQRSIKGFFAESEEAFRQAETRTLRYLSGKEGAVIATGGGAVKRAENMELLRQNGVIVFLDRQPEKILSLINTKIRPLLADDKMKIYELYEQRIGLYKKYANYIVSNNGNFADAVAALLRYVGGVGK